MHLMSYLENIQCFSTKLLDKPFFPHENVWTETQIKLKFA